MSLRIMFKLSLKQLFRSSSIRYCHNHSRTFHLNSSQSLQSPFNKYSITSHDTGALRIVKKDTLVKKNEVIGSIELDSVTVDIRAQSDGYVRWNEDVNDGMSTDVN